MERAEADDVYVNRCRETLKLVSQKSLKKKISTFLMNLVRG